MNENKVGRVLKGQTFSKVISIAENVIGITSDDYRYGWNSYKTIKFDFINPVMPYYTDANLNIFGILAYVDSDIFAAVSNYLKTYGLKYVNIEAGKNGWIITSLKPIISSSKEKPLDGGWIQTIESQMVRPWFTHRLTIPQLAALMVQFLVDEASYTDDFINFDADASTYTMNIPHSFRKNLKKKYDIFYPNKSYFQPSDYIVKGLKHNKCLNPSSNWKIVIKSKN